MISKTVTYNNLLTGEPVTEELWFHLRKDEIIRIMGRAKKDWDDYIKEVKTSMRSLTSLSLFLRWLMVNVLKMAVLSVKTRNFKKTLLTLKHTLNYSLI